MSVVLSFLPISIQSGFRTIYAQVGSWVNYSVRLIDASSPYLQRPLASTAFLIGMNLGFFEAALRIGKMVNHLLESYEPRENLTDRGKNFRAVLLGSTFAGLIGIANYSICKMFRIPLETWKVISIVIITGVFWLIWKTRTRKPS